MARVGRNPAHRLFNGALDDVHADLLIAVGRELEIGWLPPLIQQSRNGKIQPGATGYLDASLEALAQEVRVEQADGGGEVLAIRVGRLG